MARSGAGVLFSVSYTVLFTSCDLHAEPVPIYTSYLVESRETNSVLLTPMGRVACTINPLVSPRRFISQPKSCSVHIINSSISRCTEDDRSRRSAAPKPTIAGTFSVPGRMPCYCDPPLYILWHLKSRRYNAPTPIGPLILCAETDIESTWLRSNFLNSILVSAWQASTWSRPFAGRCKLVFTLPVSWFTKSTTCTNVFSFVLSDEAGVPLVEACDQA